MIETAKMFIDESERLEGKKKQICKASEDLRILRSVIQRFGGHEELEFSFFQSSKTHDGSSSCSALLLNSVMRAFRPEFVAARATDFIGMIKDCDESGFPKVRAQICKI